MRNIRLYIGGQRVDLDKSITMPFTYQTTDAEMPTSVKNSYSKTINLQGTENNRRLFGGIWHLDSRVKDVKAREPEYIEDYTETDAEFTSRAVPGEAVGDVCKITSVKGKSIVWNQLVQSCSTKGEVYGITRTKVNDYTVHYRGTSIRRATFTGTDTNINIINGHKYYAAANGAPSGTALRGGTGLIMGGTTLKVVIQATASTSMSSLGIYIPLGISVDNDISFVLIDLTLAGLDDLTAAEFEALYPLPYYDYNPGELVNNTASGVEMLDAGGNSLGTIPLNITGLTSGGVQIFPDGMKSAGSVADEWSGTTATKRIGSRAYQSGDENDSSVVTDGTTTYYPLSTPVTYTVDALPDILVPFDAQGTQRRLPVDTSEEVAAPMVCDFQYGHIQTFPIPYHFNPMKRVPFLLYVDEMVVEQGYCQLVAITRKGRDYTFSVSLFGGLGEFFYNLQTDSDGESRKLSDLDFGSDLSFRINAAYVQSNWDALLGGSLPSIAFVPMHNGVPESVNADKMLIKGGGVPSSITDGGDTYTTKDGYLLASLERKYTEWEAGDLRSYLQRPALRLKDFIGAVCDPNNNGGWAVNLDSAFFNSSNPYYEQTYILLPQLNVEESTDDICDDGKVTAFSDYPATSTKTSTLGLTSSCMTIVSNFVDMSGTAANAYLRLSLPIQLALTGQADVGALYMTNRVSHHTENKTICMMAAAWDDDGNLLQVSPRYVFTSKSHRNETGDVKKPAAPLPTSDAQVDGYFTYKDGEYKFRSDDSTADTFALVIDKIPRPSSTLKRVRLVFYLQMTTEGIPTLNRYRYGDNASNVYVSNTQFSCRILAGSNNNLSLIEPTQYASDSQVSQTALLNSLETTPLELLLSITKRFGLMWVQDNREKMVSLFTRGNYYTGELVNIHDRVDYSQGLKVTPVAAESNNYILEDDYPETTLSKAYESDWGRVYGGVRLKTGYDFGKDKVEMMDKSELKGYIDGALSGSGYWQYRNNGGALPSAIADGMSVTYYHDSGGQTDTKDIDYNLFSVSSLSKTNSPALGVASLNDDGEEKGVDIAPSLVFFAGGQIGGAWHLTDDLAAMETLNNSPCWIYDPSLASARVPRFARVATFGGVTYSLDFGTPRMTYYIPEVSLAPEQAIYHRFWEDYLGDLLSRDTKKVECYVVFPPHLDMRQEMRKFYLFDRTLWALNKVSDYDPTKEASVKCEFIRVTNKEAYK